MSITKTDLNLGEIKLMIDNQDIFNAFNQLNVLIIGDVMIDRYLSGRVSRISPEAPVPIVELQQTDNRLGGAANVALNIKALGATPYLCSVIGKDENAELFLQLLPANGLPAEGVIQSSKRITTVKTRVIAGNQHLLRVDRENVEDLSSEDAEAYLEKVRNILDAKKIHVILFQDYNKGVLSYPVIGKIILEALKRDIPTAVDPKFNNFWAYRHIDLFKPNLKEIQNQLPGLSADVASLREAAKQVRNKLKNKYTLITLSEKGLFIDKEGKGLLLGTLPRSIADVCGAGDTVISIVALGLALSLEMESMAALANLAGGQVCEKVGVVPVDKTQLKYEYEYFIEKGKQKTDNT